MTDTINDGGPAFPCQEEASTSFSGCPVTIQHSGMSLRDYFAAAALQGMLANSKRENPSYKCWYTPDQYAYDAYSCADAMLAERAKQ